MKKTGKIQRKKIDSVLLDLYAQGLNYRRIGDRVGLTAKQAQARIRTLKKQLKATEVERSPAELAKFRETIRELRGQGYTMLAIGRTVGITTPQVYRHLQAIGLE